MHLLNGCSVVVFAKLVVGGWMEVCIYILSEVWAHTEMIMFYMKRKIHQTKGG